MLNDFDVFDLTVFVDALYDAINQEEWWNQEATHDSITLTVLRVERRRPTEFFTVFSNLLAFLLPQLYTIYMLLSCHRTSQRLIRAYSSETVLCYSRNTALITNVEWSD